METAPFQLLTPRQLEILDLIARGLSNKDIGSALGISVNTVKVHVQTLLNVLDVSNRTEAVFIHQQMLQEAGSENAENLRLIQNLGRPTIAVLPLAHDGAATLRHLPAALAEDIIAGLGRWRWFNVLGFAATTDIDPDSVDYQKLDATLQADYCVSGRLHQVARNIRLNISLSRVTNAEIVWTERFDGVDDDLMVFVDGVVQHIVGQMAPELLRRGGHHSHSRSFPAWSQAARAMSLIHVPTPENSEEAMQAWEQAIDLDSTLVSAWYAKAAGLYQRVFNQWSNDPAADMNACREAAERCVSLDTGDSAAHEICGFERLVSGRLEDAIAHLQRAVELNPSNAQARSELGQALIFSNRIPEGIAELEDALAINPHGDPAWSVRGSLAYAHFLLDERDMAIAYCRQFVAINPKLALPRAMLAAFLAEDAEFEESRRLRVTLLREIPGFNAVSVVQAYAAVAPEQAQKMAAALLAAGFDLELSAPDRESGASSS